MKIPKSERRLLNKMAFAWSAKGPRVSRRYRADTWMLRMEDLIREGTPLDEITGMTMREVYERHEAWLDAKYGAGRDVWCPGAEPWNLT